MDQQDSIREAKLPKISEGDDCGTSNSGGGDKMLSMDNLQDILQYSDRSLVQDCRLVCRSWNSFLSHYRSSFKQRRHFQNLHIGYPFAPVENPKDWAALSDSKGCCKQELETLANSMVDKLLGSSVEEFLLHLVILPLDGDASTPIELSIPNRLTPASAFYLLHLMKHLGGCSFETVFREPGIHLPFNADITSTIHCRRINLCDVPLLSTLQGLTADVFKPQEVGLAVDTTRLEEALKKITDYGPLAFPLALDVWCFTQEQFDEAFQYFHTHDARSLVSEVGIKINAFDGWNAWPMEPFDPQQAINGAEEQAGGKYVFMRTNEQSNKEYRSVVKVKEEKATLVTIKFDS